VADEAIRGQAPPGEAFEQADLIGLEAMCIAEDLDRGPLGGVCRAINRAEPARG